MGAGASAGAEWALELQAEVPCSPQEGDRLYRKAVGQVDRLAPRGDKGIVGRAVGTSLPVHGAEGHSGAFHAGRDALVAAPSVGLPGKRVALREVTPVPWGWGFCLGDVWKSLLPGHYSFDDLR